MTWVIEVTSQILFSSTSSVKFELFVGRDEKSLNFNFNAVPSSRHSETGDVKDLQEDKHRRHSLSGHTKGVYSKAISLTIEDTQSLWDRPALPVWEEATHGARKSTEEKSRRSLQISTRSKKKKKQNIHLVVVTHGLHSNLGADMLYMKESIDATAKAARESRKKARQKASKPNPSPEQSQTEIPSIAPLSGGQDELEEDDDSDDEQIIVRGFPGNAIRTENGIGYLGKRLARYILDFTYPDQPVKFIKKKSLTQKITRSMSFRPGNDGKEENGEDEGVPSHDGSRIRSSFGHPDQLAYTFTSISFIGHSLGGLVQLYAIAYIQKHAPGFFEKIKPINFIGMASPFLGLSNENPTYIKFALELGAVGRTGRDLGLLWRTPAIARSGWSALVGGLGGGDKDKSHEDPRSKPLLRILPTGPAHIVLRKFRNRTVYSNVVNDGIVPLRTSCLLFLDWRGLDKVDKARRENGLVGTFVGWGWAEMTGQNSLQPPHAGEHDESADSDTNQEDEGGQSTVPQPSENAVNDAEEVQSTKSRKSGEDSPSSKQSSPTHSHGPTIDAILNFLRPTAKTTKTDKKMFSRSQTLLPDEEEDADISTLTVNGQDSPAVAERGRPRRPLATRGDSMDEGHESPAPPKTTIFESALDILSPPTPPTTWIIDPSSRVRTIFHDRVYHPEDIPPPPQTPARTGSSHSNTGTIEGSPKSIDAGMRVEEKIARAYHRDLSWRKVLVRLEPDAHNNMIVRRTFANAYGWPVIKHLCDTHFGDTYSARTRDENEPANDRAQGVDKAVPADGERVEGQMSKNAPTNVPEDMQRKGTGELKPLEEGGIEAVQARIRRDDSVEMDDSYLDDTSDEEPDQRSPFQRLWNPMSKSPSSSPEREREPSDRRKSMPVKADPAPPVVTNRLTAEPGDLDEVVSLPKITLSNSAGTSELGLRKSVTQILAEEGGSSKSVSEQVARRAVTADDQQHKL